ncbi:MAG: hypothetical protein NTY93_02560 [Candidatus Kaiserbacteria bacterium]|nr:hypothetical protein [Candidatus Kaiserbacteria bacterium]
MLTKDDKGWITDNFVTRGEFRSDMTEIKEDLKDLKKNVNKVLSAVDKFSGTVADLEQENKMGAVTLRRYGIQIEELAKATKTKISR